MLPYTRKIIRREAESLVTDTPHFYTEDERLQRLGSLRDVLDGSEDMKIPNQLESARFGHRITVTTNPGTEYEDQFSFTIVSIPDADFLNPTEVEEEFYSERRPLVQAILGRGVGEVVDFGGGNARIESIDISPMLLES